MSGTTVVSPMAGLVREILVQAGDAVSVGQELMILESMKMEVPITTEIAGIVSEIDVSESLPVEEGQSLLRISG